MQVTLKNDQNHSQAGDLKKHTFWKEIITFTEKVLKDNRADYNVNVIFNNLINNPEDYLNSVCPIVKQYVHAMRCLNEQLDVEQCLKRIIEIQKCGSYTAKETGKKHHVKAKLSYEPAAVCSLCK